MAFIATKPPSTFAPPPAGNHIARCYRLIDLGHQPKEYQGQSKGEARKIMATFELLGEDRMDDGRPFTLSRSWFLSMHEKSSMRRDLESWRGRAFTPVEEDGFDVSKLLGAYCLLNVAEETGSDGKVRTNIKAITPMLKGMQKPEAVNPAALFDSDDPDMDLFSTFSDRLKEMIRNSREWRIKAQGSRLSTTAAKPAPAAEVGAGFDDMDDDIPF